MRVTLPTALRIGPHTYPVVVEDAPSCEGAAVWGLWDGPNLLVRFDAVLAEHPTKALETVLHECLHILEAGAGERASGVSQFEGRCAGGLTGTAPYGARRAQGENGARHCSARTPLN